MNITLLAHLINELIQTAHILKQDQLKIFNLRTVIPTARGKILGDRNKRSSVLIFFKHILNPANSIHKCAQKKDFVTKLLGKALFPLGKICPYKSYLQEKDFVTKLLKKALFPKKNLIERNITSILMRFSMF